MKILLEDMRSGEVAAVDTPEPELQANGMLVRTAFSAISAGTERAKLAQGEKSLIGKARARPDLVRQVIDFARKEGIKAAYQRVQSRLDSLSPLGYSCSGIVIATSEGVTEFQPGDRVACGGGGYANHSEINFVPRNLAVKVPDEVSLDAAALTTIGSIAIQGLRQAQVNFGESVAVIGAGLVGVLTIQLARAAGCRVIAIDLSPERIENAKAMGADLGLSSTDSGTPLAVRQFTAHGADAVIITAATPSTDPIELAAAIARDRGRIVIVGDVGTGVARHHPYHKELSITFSRSYGPGRYDPAYEEDGNDYPVGYVRWTENRNMEAFLRALACGSVSVGRLIERRYPVEHGAQAYSELRCSGVYTALIEYPSAPAERVRSTAQVATASLAPTSSQSLKIGCIGAGGFAKNVIFPILRDAKGVVLQSVATASGIAAQSASKSFGFAKAQSPWDLLQDRDTGAVFVLSRHQSHARYVVAALTNHKPVFVEKPLAVTLEQLEEIRCAFDAECEQNRPPFVMVGFNRRFAPMTVKLRDFFANRREPMVVHARVNAGYIPAEHWTQQKSEGGRITGELCHFVDWARCMIGSPIRTVAASALPNGSRYTNDNVTVTLSFLDGSIANLLYLANGTSTVAKEYFEVFCEGRVGILNDFCALELARDGKIDRTKSRRDKGHRRELELTIEALRRGSAAPIPFHELVETSQACIEIQRAIRTAQPVALHGEELQSALSDFGSGLAEDRPDRLAT